MKLVLLRMSKRKILCKLMRKIQLRKKFRLTKESRLRKRIRVSLTKCHEPFDNTLHSILTLYVLVSEAIENHLVQKIPVLPRMSKKILLVKRRKSD